MGRRSFGGRGGGVDAGVADGCGEDGGVDDDDGIGDGGAVWGVKMAAWLNLAMRRNTKR